MFTKILQNKYTFRIHFLLSYKTRGTPHFSYYFMFIYKILVTVSYFKSPSLQAMIRHAASCELFSAFLSKGKSQRQEVKQTNISSWCTASAVSNMRNAVMDLEALRIRTDLTHLEMIRDDAEAEKRCSRTLALWRTTLELTESPRASGEKARCSGDLLRIVVWRRSINFTQLLWSGDDGEIAPEQRVPNFLNKPRTSNRTL